MSRAARWLLVVAVALLPPRSQAQVGDPTGTGPLAVTSTEYKIPAVSVAGIGYPVDVWAVVWYPTELPGGPYPLLLFLHGNHGICRQAGFDDCSFDPPNCPPGVPQTPNHRGYDYIAERLASWGYVVASINANAINCRDDGIPERGRLVQEHLRRWAEWGGPDGAAPFGTAFSGKVDLANVGLMGHSRGGEGVRAAYNFNREEGAPFGIRAVFEIGPVDFGALGFHRVFNAADVTFSVMLPGCDNDVSDLQGMRVYDRALKLPEANPTPKAQQFIWGASHNFFNSEWADEAGLCAPQVRMSRADQEQVGRIYVMGFFRAFIGSEPFVDLFTRDQPPPASLPTPVDNAYTESPSAILPVNDFSSSVGGAFVGLDVLTSRCHQSACGPAWPHDPSEWALSVQWPQAFGGETPSVALGVPLSGAGADVAAYQYLSFRVSPLDQAANPPLPGAQNFTVSLLDGSGNAAGAAAGDYRFLHYPVGPFGPLTILHTARVPLAAFPGVDLHDVRGVRIDFDREPDGGILVSDVAFEPPPRRPMDTFVCARARAARTTPFSPLGGVHVIDGFADQTFDLSRPLTLCNPATAGGQIADPAAFLATYLVRPAAGSAPFARRRFLRVVDTVGQTVLDAVRPDLLLVPSAQDPGQQPPPLDSRLHAVDALTCYRARPSAGSLPFPSGVQIAVSDEFTSPAKVLNVRRPRHICVPATLGATPVQNPTFQVVCYAVRPARGQAHRVARRGVYVSNDLTLGRLDTTREDELCLPSKKVP